MPDGSPSLLLPFLTRCTRKHFSSSHWPITQSPAYLVFPVGPETPTEAIKPWGLWASFSGPGGENGSLNTSLLLLEISDDFPHWPYMHPGQDWSFQEIWVQVPGPQGLAGWLPAGDRVQLCNAGTWGCARPYCVNGPGNDGSEVGLKREERAKLLQRTKQNLNSNRPGQATGQVGSPVFCGTGLLQLSFFVNKPPVCTDLGTQRYWRKGMHICKSPYQDQTHCWSLSDLERPS